MASDPTPDAVRWADELTTWSNDLEPLWDLHEKLWDKWQVTPGKRDEANPYLSQVRIPYGFHAVETILPRIVGEDPSIGYRPVDTEDDSPAAHILSGLAAWQMEQMAFKRYARDFIRQGLVTGYTVAKFAWIKVMRDEIKTRQVSEYHPQLDTTFTVDVEDRQPRPVKNQPFFEPVSTYDFVYPLYARDLDDAEAVWQRSWIPLGRLRELAKDGVYKNVEDVRADDEATQSRSRHGQFDQQNLNPSVRALSVDDDRRYVEVWERWSDDRLVVVAAPQTNPVVIRDTPNPFQHGRKPYVDWSPIPRPFQIHGIGLIAILHDLNEDYNTLRRQMSDARTWNLNPAWTGPDGALPGNQVVLQPGAYVPQDELGGEVRPFLLPVVDFGAANAEAERLIGDMQNMSGAFNYLSGSDSGANASQTATGVATITNEGNKRIAEMIHVFSERTMKRAGRLLSSMNAQYVDTPVAVNFSHDPEAQQEWMKFTGSNQPPRGLVNVNPGMMQAVGRLEPIPDVGQDKAVNETQRRSDATQLIQALAPFLTLPTQPINIPVLVKHVAKAFGMDRVEVEQMLDTSAQQAQLAQLQQAQAQQSGPSGPSGENAPTGNVVGAPGAAGS